jgi:hypothetical protein
MFRHLTDNDPRPHFFHQSNLADYNPALPAVHPAQGGILYSVIDALVDRYEAAFDRAGTPLVQLTSGQAAETLARQEAWAAGRAAVTAWLQDGRVHVRNGGASAVTVPLTGTTAGEPYGGRQSGWVTLAAGAEASYAPADPASADAPIVSGRARVGETLTVSNGSWKGTPEISFARQWQRCQGSRCVNIAGATDTRYVAVAADEGKTLRAAVLAGNWRSSVSQAFSAPTAAVAPKPVDPPRPGTRGDDPPGPRGGGTPDRPGTRPAKLRLTKLRMTPRRFAVSHRRLPRGTRLDGTRISWRLNRAATVRLTFQKRTGKGWKRVGVVSRHGKAGVGEVRFRGRFGRKLLKPHRYRVVVVAAGGGDRTAARRLGFRVLKG